MKIASENGFYLIPNKVYESMFNKIDYLESEIKRLKKSRDDWKRKLKEYKKWLTQQKNLT